MEGETPVWGCIPVPSSLNRRASVSIVVDCRNAKSTLVPMRCLAFTPIALGIASFVACSSAAQQVGSDGGSERDSSQDMDANTASSDEDGTAIEEAAPPLGEASSNEDGTPIEDAARPPIDVSKLMPSLSDAELGQMCDWMYPQLGGYAQVIQCSGGTRQNPADQSGCISSIRFNPAGCLMTVGQFEECIVARSPSKGCASPEPPCTAFFYCHLQDQ